jgi:hypothetical protein
MRNLFLDEFTNTIRDEILQKRKYSEEAKESKRYSLATSYERECDNLWYALMLYYRIVLKRRRFLYQQIHAASVLEKLDPVAWKIWTSRKKKNKPDQIENDNTESDNDQNSDC